MARKRTTIEIDEELLERAKRALGAGTARWAIEESLRRAVEGAEGELRRRAGDQLSYLRQLRLHADVAVLESEEMWR
jgi:Arc/MetJ family transcription regulator